MHCFYFNYTYFYILRGITVLLCNHTFRYFVKESPFYLDLNSINPY
jgi:hypothetical protein